MSQESIKSLLDKINLLFNVFMKDGLEKVSSLEKDLLREQIQNLLQEVDKLELKSMPVQEAKNEKLVEEVKEAPKVKEELSNPIEVVIETPVSVPVQELVEEVIEKSVTPKVEVKEAKEEVHSLKEEKEYSNSTPTRSLKEIIDLNKSFILKAELFDNNHSLYTLFIETLNSFQSEKDSMRFVEETAKNKSWDLDEKSYELLVRAVEKRFLPLLQQ